MERIPEHAVEPKTNRVIDIINWGCELFIARRIPYSRYNIEVLLEHVVGKKRAELYLDHDRRLSPREMKLLAGYVKKRLDRRPLWHLVGEIEFFGLRLRVNERVLIPRPETEILVDTALREIANLGLDRVVYIADVGTGSGNMAIALANERSDLFIYATDISADALLLAEENARANGVEGAISFMEGDLFAPFKKAARARLDIVVSNPPYVSTRDWMELPPEVREREPRSALYGGEDGLEIISRLIEEAPNHLQPGGRLIFEVGQGQASCAGLILENSGAYGRIEVHMDYCGVERVLLAVKK